MPRLHLSVLKVQPEFDLKISIQKDQFKICCSNVYGIFLIQVWKAGFK